MATHTRFHPAEGGECTCPRLKDTLKLAMAGKQPECEVHNPAPADPTGDVALNDDVTLAAVIGLPLARPTHNQPLDAA